MVLGTGVKGVAMLDLGEQDEISSVGWISMTDLLMVGLVVFAGAAAKYHQVDEQAKNAQKKIAAVDRQLEIAKAGREKAEENLERILRQTGDRDELWVAIERLKLWLTNNEQNLSKYNNLSEMLVATESRLVDLQDLLKDKENQLRSALKAVEMQAGELILTQQASLESEQKIADLDRRRVELEVLVTKLREQLKSTELLLLETQKKLHDLQRYTDALDVPTAEKIASWRLMESELTTLRDQQKKVMLDLDESLKREGELKMSVTSLKSDLDKNLEDRALAEVREQGFRQELLGIRSRSGSFRRVIFIVDHSGSMGDDGRWEYVKGVIENWLLLLPFEEVRLVLFNDKVNEYPRSGLFVTLGRTAESRQDAIKPLVQALKDTAPTLGTNTSLALKTAYESRDVDAMFLFTDGQPMIKPERDTTSEDFRALQDEVLAMITAREESGESVPINVIGLGDYFSHRLAGPEQKHLPFGVFLTRIAKLSGGSFLGR